MQRNNWLIAISIITVIVLLNNTIYYFLTKNTLEQSLHDEMKRDAEQIVRLVEQSRVGADLFEDQIARELRASSIAIQYALDPDIDKVSNKQLDELRQKLGLKHITLLRQLEDDIILDKSTDPTQHNESTSGWVPWNAIFKELFEDHQVSTKWLGLILDHFWSGPFEVSSTDVGSIYKWGYYHDGTTNYIIDPYVDYSVMNDYKEVTGVDPLINDIIEVSDSIVEVTVINPTMFPEGNTTEMASGEIRDHKLQYPVLNGTYSLKYDQDVLFVQQAYNDKITVTKDVVIDGKKLVKMFIPVFLDGKTAQMTDLSGEPIDSYVLALVADKKSINDKLSDQFLSLGIVVIILTGFSLLIAYLIIRRYQQYRDKAVRVAQETYIEEINGLFHSIKAQRHDFINHVQTIHSLAELNKTKELAAYTKELTGEIRMVSDIINIGNPAIAALIRSKISQGERCQIELQCSFQGFKMDEMGAKTLDINRIIGNLIDNAFDEVTNYAPNERKVEIIGRQSSGCIELIVRNRCKQAEEIASQPLFDSGFSLKKQKHQGLGLAIVKSIVEQYKGEIKIAAEPDECITFTVKLPL